MDVKGGKLRGGMARDDDAVEGILSHCCGREAMPVPMGIARLHNVVAETLTEGCERRTLLAPLSALGVFWLRCLQPLT